MAQHFRVLYDFTAEEDGELSVRAGDVVALVGACKSFRSRYRLRAHASPSEGACGSALQAMRRSLPCFADGVLARTHSLTHSPHFPSQTMARAPLTRTAGSSLSSLGRTARRASSRQVRHLHRVVHKARGWGANPLCMGPGVRGPGAPSYPCLMTEQDGLQPRSSDHAIAPTTLSDYAAAWSRVEDPRLSARGIQPSSRAPLMSDRASERPSAASVGHDTLVASLQNMASMQPLSPSVSHAMGRTTVVAPGPGEHHNYALVAASTSQAIVPVAAGAPPILTSDDYMRIFSAHEEWFRAATLKRQEVSGTGGGAPWREAP